QVRRGGLHDAAAKTCREAGHTSAHQQEEEPVMAPTRHQPRSSQRPLRKFSLSVLLKFCLHCRTAANVGRRLRHFRLISACSALSAVAFSALSAFSAVSLQAQRGRGAPPAPPAAPRAAAPIDLTGYWVSLVTDDWRWRMVTPPKGDVLYLPVNAEGRRAAEAGDPAKDKAAGEQCRAYGAGGLMHLPGRLRISWQDDRTLVVEADAGTQTRVLHFGGEAPAGEAPSWQGYSTALW